MFKIWTPGSEKAGEYILGHKVGLCWDGSTGVILVAHLYLEHRMEKCSFNKQLYEFFRRIMEGNFSL